jgi:hypothetical protein
MWERGFWVCGNPSFGLRRQLVDENRKPKLILAPGRRKHIQSDSFILVTGPRSEVMTVRWIFRAFSRRLR